ncbi:DNA-binding domain-containing protein [Aeromonas encheleia]|uniref:HvfC/BufC family peptide modification chaperone n=1 Tax=Aeromonas encheleia TaxID=73010 RepID=UPI001F575F5A|nr:putative DNA-binding domain-containing protein [Aeromonas encheleia]UNP89489.1 DNA-binding domain-containing protein [Aeromonas encheleia]
MSELANLQQAFARGLLGEDDAILAQIHSSFLPAESVLRVYRNHFILSLTEVLAGSYPAVKAMVGEAFFAAAARGFVLAEPLREGSVMHYGDGFGDWLAHLPTTVTLPWLGELARFEWALDRAALLEPEPRRWPAERLAAVPPERWEQLVLLPAGDLLLFESSYPVLALWQMALHQGATVTELDAPCHLVLKKQRDHRVMPLPLDLAAWTLLLGCRQGAPLARLLAQTPSAAEHLTPLITLDLLVDLELMP